MTYTYQLQERPTYYTRGRSPLDTFEDLHRTSRWRVGRNEAILLHRLLSIFHQPLLGLLPLRRRSDWNLNGIMVMREQDGNVPSKNSFAVSGSYSQPHISSCTITHLHRKIIADRSLPLFRFLLGLQKLLFLDHGVPGSSFAVNALSRSDVKVPTGSAVPRGM